MEDLLYVRAEVARERDGERQRGGVALLLDRIDGLARDGHRLAELLLGEPALGAQLLDTVVHRCRWKVSFTSHRCQANFPSSSWRPTAARGTPRARGLRARRRRAGASGARAPWRARGGGRRRATRGGRGTGARWRCPGPRRR